MESIAMKKLSWMLSLLLCAGLSIGGAGCALLVVGGAAAAGAGTAAYVRGDLKANLDATLDQTLAATRAALKELQMPITVEEKDGLSGKLTARAVGDKKIGVRVNKVTGTLTEVAIRVGTWGDETMSREILDKIKQRL